MTPSFVTSIGVLLSSWLLLLESSEALISQHYYSSKPLCQTNPLQQRPTFSKHQNNVDDQRQQRNQNRGISTSLRIGNFLGNDKTQQDVSLPRDVKDAVAKCKASVQQALQDKCSRMDIEMYVPITISCLYLHHVFLCFFPLVFLIPSFHLWYRIIFLWQACGCQVRCRENFGQTAETIERRRE